MQEQRFTLDRLSSGTLLIKDNKTGTLVCSMSSAGRPKIYTQKMAEVMVEALNAAIQGTKE